MSLSSRDWANWMKSALDLRVDRAAVVSGVAVISFVGF